MRRSVAGSAAFVLALLCFVARASEEGQPAAVSTVETTRIHASGNEFERKMLDAILACLREDSAGTVDALDQLDAACRRLSPSTPGVSHGILVYDQALHISLAKSRELADRGELAKAFDEMVWVSRQCFKCHQVARNEGQLPGVPGSVPVGAKP